MKLQVMLSKFIFILFCSLLIVASANAADNVKLKGSGASFPFPLYGQWFKAYNKAHRHIQIDYQAKGSGAGIKDFINHTVDFAASDAAMDDEQMAAVKEGVQLLPMTAGEVVLAYNLPDGPKALKLSREAYTKIFLGEISKWNDPIIAKSNPDAEMPDTEITVVRRADSSGTTFVFTQHLSAVSEAFKNGPGTGTTVKWPSSDKFVAAPKNDGVTATIKQTPGAIGYIEYGYAKLTNLPMASLENKAASSSRPHSKRPSRPGWGRDAPICASGCRIRKGRTPIPSSPIPGCCSTSNTMMTTKWRPSTTSSSTA